MAESVGQPRRDRRRRRRLDKMRVVGLPQLRFVEQLLDHLRAAYPHPNRKLHFGGRKGARNRIPSLLLTFAVGPLHAAESSDPDNRNAAGEDADPPHAVIVLTNHATLGHTGEPTGYFLPEAAHPWHVFTEAGFTVSFASPAGGPAPLDPTSLDRDDPANAAFLDDPDVQRALDHTTPLDEIDPANVDALVFAGGHGTMWDLPANPVVANAIVSVHDAGGVVAAVCHGPACFVGVVTESGRPFVEGRRLAAFTDNEERAAAKAAVVPFLLETRHRELGAEVITAPNWREQVVVDGRLVTGQNPASADKMAREVVRVVRGE